MNIKPEVYAKLHTALAKQASPEDMPMITKKTPASLMTDVGTKAGLKHAIVSGTEVAPRNEAMLNAQLLKINPTQPTGGIAAIKAALGNKEQPAQSLIGDVSTRIPEAANTSATADGGSPGKSVNLVPGGKPEGLADAYGVAQGIAEKTTNPETLLGSQGALNPVIQARLQNKAVRAGGTPDAEAPSFLENLMAKLQNLSTAGKIGVGAGAVGLGALAGYAGHKMLKKKKRPEDEPQEKGASGIVQLVKQASLTSKKKDDVVSDGEPEDKRTFLQKRPILNTGLHAVSGALLGSLAGNVTGGIVGNGIGEAAGQAAGAPLARNPAGKIGAGVGSTLGALAGVAAGLLLARQDYNNSN